MFKTAYLASLIVQEWNMEWSFINITLQITSIKVAECDNTIYCVCYILLSKIK